MYANYVRAEIGFHCFVPCQLQLLVAAWAVVVLLCFPLFAKLAQCCELHAAMGSTLASGISCTLVPWIPLPWCCYSLSLYLARILVRHCCISMGSAPNCMYLAASSLHDAGMFLRGHVHLQMV